MLEGHYYKELNIIMLDSIFLNFGPSKRGTIDQKRLQISDSDEVGPEISKGVGFLDYCNELARSFVRAILSFFFSIYKQVCSCLSCYVLLRPPLKGASSFFSLSLSLPWILLPPPPWP